MPESALVLRDLYVYRSRFTPWVPPAGVNDKYRKMMRSAPFTVERVFEGERE
ncbi:hypothetical protein M3J09_010005 [Ascochyta lentis]